MVSSSIPILPMRKLEAERFSNVPNTNIKLIGQDWNPDLPPFTGRVLQKLI